MSDSTPKMISAKILRAFRDDGTKTNFVPGEKVEQFEEGTFDNYKAAGLVEAVETATPSKTKPGA